MTNPNTNEKGVLAPGSLFNTSEGLLSAALTGLVTTVVTTEGYSENLKMVAIGGLAFAVAVYIAARAMVKRYA
jgi:hypothetical protein